VRISVDVCTRLLTVGLATGLLGTAFIGSIEEALAECKPDHFRPPYFIKTMGQCGFDSETLSFRGTSAQQAMCLMRGMDTTRNLGPTLEGLPPGLARRVGETSGLPSREVLSSYLSKLDLEWSFAAYLWQPLSHARDNDPNAPAAKYFVIHDTSGPYYGHRAFPDDINVNPKVNNLRSFACADEWGKAHVVLNRMGDMLLNHDFSIPWRETKFEQAAEFGGQLKGLFVHIEMIQPRRAGSGGGDGHSPDPAFTQAQYDRLALLYTIASVRGDRWLIPAFHAALDADIRNGHDDPLNFKVDSFADSLDRLIEKLRGSEQFQASNSATATDALSDNPRPESDGIWIDAQWDNPRKTGTTTDASANNPPKSNVAAATDSAPLPDANSAQANSNSAPNPAAAPGVAPGAAEMSPPPGGQPSSQANTQTNTQTGAPPKAKLAARESETPHEQKSAKKSIQKPADAVVCTTHRGKGRRQRTCEPDSGGDIARPRGGDHPHHARGSSRHHRA
jgi:hypothetical protein